MPAADPAVRLRARPDRTPVLVVPGAASALTARITEDLGAEAALQGAAKGTQRVLRTLRETGSPSHATGLAPRDGHQRLVHEARPDELDNAYAVPGPAGE